MSDTDLTPTVCQLGKTEGKGTLKERKQNTFQGPKRLRDRVQNMDRRIGVQRSFTGDWGVRESGRWGAEPNHRKDLPNARGLGPNSMRPKRTEGNTGCGGTVPAAGWRVTRLGDKLVAKKPVDSLWQCGGPELRHPREAGDNGAH